MEIEDINIKSEEVQEILGTPPSSILRWGITVVFLIVALFLLMSYIVKYPDKIEGQATLSTQNPPIKVSSYTNGTLAKVYIKDQEKIAKGQPLALIESTAELEDVLEIEQLIYSLDTVSAIGNIDFKDKRKAMGEIQDEYTNFLSAFNALSFFYANNFEAASNGIYQNQISQVKKQYKKLLNQKFLLIKEIEILQKQLKERKQLYLKNVVSEEDYNNFKRSVFAKQQEAEQLRVRISENKIQQSNLESNISTNSFNRSLKDNETLMQFEEAKDLLISKIKWWKKKYLISSPIAGMVSFNENSYENQQVQIAEILYTIIPENEQKIAKIEVPLSGIGKIEKGQTVWIEILAYPAAEFGYLESKVENISLIANEKEAYLVQALLPKSLITTYQKELAFKPEMQGTARIIASEKRIATRIFEQFRALIENK